MPSQNIIPNTILIAAFAFFSFAFFSNLNKTPQSEEERVNEWFAENHIFECELNLKERLKDPDSYVTADKKLGYFTLVNKNKVYTWEFRSKNGFGGYSNEIAECTVSKSEGGSITTRVLD